MRSTHDNKELLVSIHDEHGEQETGSEKRRYYRVEDHLALRFRLVSPEEYQNAMEIAAGQQTERSLAASFATSTRQMDFILRRIKEDDPDIADYLNAVNEKIDLLARTLSQEESSLAKEPLRRVDLSAAGISFHTAQYLSPGSTLELRALLFPSFVHINTLIEIVRCTEEPDPETGRPYRIAADFKIIRDEDRELLIQHITQREAALLRERRATLD